MTDWALSIGCNQTGLNEWKVYVAKSMYNLQPCYYSHVNSWAHWTITGMDGKRLTTKWVILFTWLLKSSSAEVTLWLSIYMEHKHLHILLSRDVYLHTSPLLQISLPPVFQPYSSPVPDHPAKPLVITHETIQSSICPLLLPNKVSNQVHCPKSSPLEGLAFTTVFQGYSRVGPQGYSCPFSGGTCISWRTICKSHLSLVLQSINLRELPMKP